MSLLIQEGSRRIHGATSKARSLHHSRPAAIPVTIRSPSGARVRSSSAASSGSGSVSCLHGIRFVSGSRPRVTRAPSQTYASVRCGSPQPTKARKSKDLAGFLLFRFDLCRACGSSVNFRCRADCVQKRLVRFVYLWRVRNVVARQLFGAPRRKSNRVRPRTDMTGRSCARSLPSCRPAIMMV